MKGSAYDSFRRTFRPSVGNLEERNLMSVAGVTQRIRPPAQLGAMVKASSNGHKTPVVMPLRVLEGTWANQTWVTKVFADMYPSVPAVSQSVDTNRLVGNSIVSTDSVGEFTADWSITAGRRGLMLRVQASGIPVTIEMPGRRIGPATWVFKTSTSEGDTESSTGRMRSVITVPNRNTYSFSNFSVSGGMEQLLYVSVHTRVPANFVTRFVSPEG